MALLLQALLLLCADEVDSARQALSEAYAACDRSAADRAIGILVKLNNDRCPEALAQAFKTGADLLADLEKDQKKYAKEVEANEIVRDKDGRPYSKGDLTRYYAAKKAFDAITLKTDVLNIVLPRSMLQMSKLSSIPGLAAVLRGSPEWLPRAAAADGLARSDDPAALEALLAQAKVESSPGVRTAIAEALGLKARESEEAKKVLFSWIESPFWQIRIVSARALARSGDRKRCVPPLIAVLRTSNGRVRYEINESLKALTGVTKHGDPAAWKAWWDANEEELLGGTYVVKPFERADEQGITSFFGIPFHSSRVVFIIDSSSSMGESGKWKPEATESDKLEGDRRIDVAKFELRKIVRQMPENALFDIFAVNAGVTLLNDKMVAASKPTREGAFKFIQGLQLKIGTDLHGALSRSLDFAGGGWNAPLREDSIDTLYFLSDGVPTYGVTDRTRLVNQMLDAVRYKRIVIHTIACDAPPQGKIVLKSLADATGGQLVER
jgi:hypothetical protein